MQRTSSISEEYEAFLRRVVSVLGQETLSAMNQHQETVLGETLEELLEERTFDKVTDEMITAFNIKTIVQFKSESSNINQCQYLGTREDVKVIELKSFECISPEVILERLMSNRQKFVDRNKKRVQMEENYVAGKSFIAGN